MIVSSTDRIVCLCNCVVHLLSHHDLYLNVGLESCQSFLVMGQAFTAQTCPRAQLAYVSEKYSGTLPYLVP